MLTVRSDDTKQPRKCHESNDRSYVNDYCFACEVTDGTVKQIREYMDPRRGWTQAFGKDEPAAMLAFVEQ